MWAIKLMINIIILWQFNFVFAKDKNNNGWIVASEILSVVKGSKKSVKLLVNKEDSSYRLILNNGKKEFQIAANETDSISDSSQFVKIKKYKNELFVAVWVTGAHYIQYEIFDAVMGKSLLRVSSRGDGSYSVVNERIALEVLSETPSKKGEPQFKTETVFFPK